MRHFARERESLVKCANARSGCPSACSRARRARSRKPPGHGLRREQVISVRFFVIEPEAGLDMFMRRLEIADLKFHGPSAVMRLKQVYQDRFAFAQC